MTSNNIITPNHLPISLRNFTRRVSVSEGRIALEAKLKDEGENDYFKIRNAIEEQYPEPAEDAPDGPLSVEYPYSRKKIHGKTPALKLADPSMPPLNQLLVMCNSSLHLVSHSSLAHDRILQLFTRTAFRSLLHTFSTLCTDDPMTDIQEKIRVFGLVKRMSGGEMDTREIAPFWVTFARVQIAPDDVRTISYFVGKPDELHVLVIEAKNLAVLGNSDGYRPGVISMGEVKDINGGHPAQMGEDDIYDYCADIRCRVETALRLGGGDLRFMPHLRGIGSDMNSAELILDQIADTLGAFGDQAVQQLNSIANSTHHTAQSTAKTEVNVSDVYDTLKGGPDGGEHGEPEPSFQPSGLHHLPKPAPEDENA